MRILHVNKFFCKIGGAENIMFQEAEMLQRKGHEVFFFATDRQPYLIENYEYADKFAKYTNYSGLSLIDSVLNLPKILYDRGAEKKFENFLDEIKPDIVHCHEFFYNLTPSFLEACYKRGIPVVMTLHTARLVCPAGTLMKNNTIYCEEMPCTGGNSFSCIKNNCLKSYSSSFVFALEFAFRKIHKKLEKINCFISPSQALLNLALKSGIDKEKFLLINNFLDQHYFDNRPDYSAGNYFLFVGRLAKDKGVHYLIEAMKLLPKEIELHIVGTGPQEDYFNDMAKGYSLDNIKFMGYKAGKELEEEYKNCIASILPCYWFENFPTTIIESFTYGKPVIASHIGGIPEMVEHGRQGLTFEPTNVMELANSIEELYNSPELVKEMGKNVRTKAENLYNPELHYEKLIAVYEKAIDLKNKAGLAAEGGVAKPKQTITPSLEVGGRGWVSKK